MAIKITFLTDFVTAQMPAIKWLAILVIDILMSYYFGKFIWETGSKLE
jgi:hypothetical protein